jgi:precorrin-3B C17-methyltransferase
MQTKGKVYVIGIGPGLPEYRSPASVEAIKSSDVIVGYKTYINLIEDLIETQEISSSGMRKEVDRCAHVLELAKDGKTVSLVSSGDAGVYGMAGIMLEMADDSVDIEVVPGITAANAAAACLGAPLMHDYAVISLSDLLTDWELIKKRLHHASEGDFVIALYNPRSKGRQTQIVEAREIMMKSKDSSTPVGIVRNAKRDDQSVVVTTLEEMLNHEIDMFSMVIIGNKKSYIKDGKMVTPRGYAV